MTADILLAAWGLALVGAFGGVLVVSGVDRMLRWLGM